MRKIHVTVMVLLLGAASAAVGQRVRMTRPGKEAGPTEVRVALLVIGLLFAAAAALGANLVHSKHKRRSFRKTHPAGFFLGRKGA